MHRFLIVFFALVSFADTASADGVSGNVKKTAPGGDDSINSPGLSTKEIRNPRTSRGDWRGTGKEDATPKRYIGETEKNLSSGVRERRR